MNKKIVALLGVLIIGIAAYYFFALEKNAVKSSAQAITLAQKQVPELAEYSLDTLPPKRIESRETETGWLLGFFMEGSGVKGILSAKCYAVSKEGKVEETGSYQADENVPPAEKIELSNCVPTNAAPVPTPSATVSGKKWMWTQALYNDGRKIVPKKDVFSITLLNDGTFTVTTDCNGRSGKYTKTDTTISFTDIVRTEMACGNSQESEFITMLSNVDRYHFGLGGELILEIKFDSGVVVFR